MYARLVSHVLGREVVLAIDGAGLRAGPVLADQGALPLSLLGVAGGKAQAMARGEEKVRRLAEHTAEPAAGRLLSSTVSTFQPGRCDAGRDRLHQMGAGRPAHRVALVGGSEETGPPFLNAIQCPSAAAGLGRDHALGVAPVVFDLVEAQAADAILDVELVLERKGIASGSPTRSR